MKRSLCFPPWRVWSLSNRKTFRVSRESAASWSTLQLLSRSTTTCLLIIHKAADEDPASFFFQIWECSVGKCSRLKCLFVIGMNWVAIILGHYHLLHWVEASRSGLFVLDVSCRRPEAFQPMSSCFLWSLQSTPLTPECAKRGDLRPLLTIALLIIQTRQVLCVVDKVLFYFKLCCVVLTVSIF